MHTLSYPGLIPCNRESKEYLPNIDPSQMNKILQNYNHNLMLFAIKMLCTILSNIT